MIINSNTDFKEILSTIPDWSREQFSGIEWCPSKALIDSIRKYAKYSNSGNAFHKFLKKTTVLKYRFWSMVTGAGIPIDCQIGGGILFPHPNGIVIHPDVKIGPNCLIFQQVTLGMRRGGVPIIGGHVDIGAGAKVLGGITVGDHAVIGAIAVVLQYVPAGAMAVGIRAVVKARRS